MTNEEAYNIISEFCFTGYEDNKKPSFKLFGAIHELILDVEENTKLKAEIEQYKKETAQDKIDYAYDLGYQSCLNYNGVSWKDAEEIQKLRKEINQLKSELEQLIKLPCKVGDVVYDNDFGKPTPSAIVGYSFGNIFQDDYSEIDEEQIYFYSKSNRFNIDMSFPVSEIGKTIFLSQEEAEQSLKAAQP